MPLARAPAIRDSRTVQSEGARLDLIPIESRTSNPKAFFPTLSHSQTDSPMDFIDLKSQYRRIAPQVNERIQAVLNHGLFILGAEHAELEARLAKYVGVKHCIGASSGTDTLLIALMALNIGP